MGGSMNMLPGFSFGASEPPKPPQYTNDQLLDYARSNSGNYDEFSKYKSEIVSQLKNGSYKDPYGVWQAVRNGNFAAEQEKAAQNALSMLMQSPDSNGG